MRLLLCVLLLFTAPAALSAAQSLDEEQLFVQRLLHSDLPRLGHMVWQEVAQQRSRLTPAQLFLHHSQELQFLLLELRAAESAEQRRELERQCLQLMQNLRSQTTTDLDAHMASVLTQFSLLEYLYWQQQGQTPEEASARQVKALDNLIAQLNDLRERGEQRLEGRRGMMTIGAWRQEQQNLSRLRYARAWSRYYQARLLGDAAEKTLWQAARSDLEGFLDRPLDSEIFVRALIAVCRSDEALGQRLDALYLLDDVEMDIDQMPLASALQVWREHLRLIEDIHFAPRNWRNYRLRVEMQEHVQRLAANLQKFLNTQGSESQDAVDRLRIDAIDLMLRLHDTGQQRWAEAAQEQIDVLFQNGSPLAEQCLPYVLKLAVSGRADTELTQLAAAESAFQLKQYRKAAGLYQAVLAEDGVIEEGLLRDLLQIKSSLAWHYVDEPEQALALLTPLLGSVSQQRLQVFALSMWLRTVTKLLRNEIAVPERTWNVLLDECDAALLQSARQDVLRHVQVLLKREHYKRARHLLEKLLSDNQDDIGLRLMQRYTDLAARLFVDQEELISCIADLHLHMDDLNAQTLHFLTEQLLSIDQRGDQVFTEQITLCTAITSSSRFAAEQKRTVELLLAQLFIDRGSLQSQVERLDGLLNSEPLSAWEVERLVAIGDYLADYALQHKNRHLEQIALRVYDQAADWLRRQEQQQSLAVVQLAQADLLMRSGAHQRAAQILKLLPHEMQETWNVQAARIRCLEMSGDYTTALNNWRLVSKRLKKGGQTWLRCKWHIAQCLYRLGEAEQALKLLDYLLLLHQDMPQQLRSDYTELRRKCRYVPVDD